MSFIKTPSNFGNFTEKLKDKDVILFSDSEGYMPTGIKNKIVSHAKAANGAVIFNGDAADYTSRMLDTTKSDRFFFLQLIKMVNENPNFLATLGNRDLNKLVLWQLVQRKDKTKWWKQENEKGKDIHIDITITDILMLAKKLYDSHNEGKTSPDWLVENLESFLPYWNATNEKKDKDGKFLGYLISTWKGWESRIRKLSLYERYLAIFGADPSDGTMSAVNNIIGLFTELGIGYEYLQKLDENFKYQKDEDPSTSLKPYNKWSSELLNFGAAFVFTVYARILDNELALAVKPNWEYDGCLFKFLTTNPLIGYTETDKSIYLFSHGGVNSSFTTDLIEKMNSIYETIDGAKLFMGSPDDISLKAKQKGGSVESLEGLSRFNSNVVSLINNYYSEIKISTNQTENKILRVLIGLACPIGNHAAFSSIPAFHTQSPIMSGIIAMFEDKGKLFSTESRQIVNIFGHSPNGIGYSFSTTATQSLVCSDFSNTFINSPNTGVESKYDDNSVTLHLDFQKNEFYLNGETYLKKLSKATSYESDKKGSFLMFVEPPAEEFKEEDNSYKITFKKEESIDLKLKYKESSAFYNGAGYIDELNYAVRWIKGDQRFKQSRFNIFSMKSKPPIYNFNVILQKSELEQQKGGYKKPNKSKQIKKSVKTRKTNLVKNKKSKKSKKY
jgi:hypothetical protein